MNSIFYCVLGILIPFIGTSLGSAFVFFIKKNINALFHKSMIGFAIGVMVAASIWSLIIPSIEIVEKSRGILWLPAFIGFILGILFLIIIDKIANNIEKKIDGKGLNMLIFSVTIHNIPEGMAIGVCFAGFLAGNAGIELMGAMMLAVGIAIQNIPEGSIISIPLKLEGKSRGKSFLYGVLSGIVEPIAAFITIILINIVVPILPYLLSFAAGAMIYVVIEELVPEMHYKNKSCWGIIGVGLGFSIMMILDVALR